MFTLAAFTALIVAVTAAPAPLAARAITKGKYTPYHGDGSTGAGWPAMSAWTDFETMWTNNLNMIQNSCSPYTVPNTTLDEATELKAAIQAEATASNVDARFILAVVLQESKGCVRVWSTVSPDGKVRNPGLMQDHSGDHNCNSGSAAGGSTGVQTPCPQAQIAGMIHDGVAGTAAGDGLRQTLNAAPGKDAQSAYQAARLYNSGASSSLVDLVAGGSTSPYASDIANRVTGVVFDNSPFPA